MYCTKHGNRTDGRGNKNTIRDLKTIESHNNASSTTRGGIAGTAILRACTIVVATAPSEVEGRTVIATKPLATRSAGMQRRPALTNQPEGEQEQRQQQHEREQAHE